MIDTAPLRRKLLDLALTGKLVPKQGEWRTVKLKDVLDLQAGKNISADNIHEPSVEFRYPCYGGNGIRGYVHDYNTEGEHVIIGRQGALCGNVKFAKDKFYATEHAVVVSAHPEVDMHYAYWALMGLNLNQYATATAQPGLSVKVINEVLFPLPPLTEQKAIVKRLEELLKVEGEIAAESAALDDLITAAKRKILSLAISGRLVPRQGEWKSVKLGEMCEVINGLWKGVKKPFVNVGVIRAANFTKDCKLNLEKTVYIDVEAGKYETRKLQEDDLIVERSGGGPGQPVGRVVLFPKVDGEYSISNFTSILRITDWRTANPKYLHMALVTIYNTGYTEKIQTQTTNLHNLNFKEYLNIPIPLPSLAEQKAIVARVEGLFGALDAVNGSMAVGCDV